MEHISKVLTSWTGSKITEEMVREQIKNRFGTSAAESFDPRYDARGYKQWLKIGYRVKAGQKALNSFVILEEKDDEGKVIKRHSRRINLFSTQQVERVRP